MRGSVGGILLHTWPGVVNAEKPFVWSGVAPAHTNAALIGIVERIEHHILSNPEHVERIALNRQ